MSISDIALILFVVVFGGWSLWRSQVEFAHFQQRSTKPAQHSIFNRRNR